ncbi:uncharacterized protein C8A04DRAFT_24581 [Dichotomopilus funicola]|uniref:Uncharacterized protein n=1 Tax=Dichotomopilus funicola TaxID=1934379 RepID=A0AAN6ZRH1_9PEZI|nr:hypothetical protein C8A04DRAFT_24581 [Dichotomopilus funicola]
MATASSGYRPFVSSQLCRADNADPMFPSPVLAVREMGSIEAPPGWEMIYHPDSEVEAVLDDSGVPLGNFRPPSRRGDREGGVIDVRAGEESDVRGSTGATGRMDYPTAQNGKSETDSMLHDPLPDRGRGGESCPATPTLKPIRRSPSPDDLELEVSEIVEDGGSTESDSSSGDSTDGDFDTDWDEDWDVIDPLEAFCEDYVESLGKTDG